MFLLMYIPLFFIFLVQDGFKRKLVVLSYLWRLITFSML